MSYQDENLKDLLQQFVDEAQARSIADEIRYADAAFDAHPAPTVPPHIKTSLDRTVQNHLAALRNRRIVLRWFSAAATVLIAAGLFVCFETRPLSQPTAHTAQHRQVHLEGFYSSDMFANDIENDISELFNAFNNADTGSYEPVDTLQLNLNEIEDQLVADSTEFWKG